MPIEGSRQPRRTILRGAQVISMAEDRADCEAIDVLIEDDRIAGMGSELDVAGAEIDDLSGRIVLPGLINAHLHTWQTATRSIGADWTLLGYLATMHGTLAPQMTPEDMHVATLAGALNQIDCGTTTLGDWCHANHTPEHTDASVEALVASGIRAVFMHGAPGRTPETPFPVAELDRLHDEYAGANALLDVGMAVPGPQGSTAETAAEDFRAAIERGTIVSMHQSGGALVPAWDALWDAGLFGPHTNIVHGASIPDEWLARLSSAGVTFTCTPENELAQGHGMPITGRLLRLDSAPSLGTDTEAVVAGDVQTAARVALAVQRAFDHEEARSTDGLPSPTPTITVKQALAWATIQGARALGLADRLGRLEVGRSADLVVLDTRSLNLSPKHGPIALAIQAHPGNVEAVMIAGQWRKREHRLVGVDLEAIRDQLAASGERLLSHLQT